jgi:hypothetical protein
LHLQDIFKTGRNFIQAINDLSCDNQFTNTVGKADSIGSLLSVGLSAYYRIKDDLKTPAEKAFDSLMRLALESAKESLTEISNEISNLK